MDTVHFKIQRLISISQFICKEGRNLKLKMKKKTLYFSMEGMREKVRNKVNFEHISEL